MNVITERSDLVSQLSKLKIGASSKPIIGSKSKLS